MLSGLKSDLWITNIYFRNAIIYILMHKVMHGHNMSVEEKAVPPTFSLDPVTEKPTRKYRKGSKYDPILEAFRSGRNNLVAVNIEGKDANYIRTQLNKRIDANKRKNRGVVVSVVNNVCYLEKNIKPKTD